MNKQTVVYSDNGILYSNEGEQIVTIQNNVDGSLKHNGVK